MEKRDLEIKLYGHVMGAFEDVTNLVEGDNYVEFDSADGHMRCEKDAGGCYWCNQLRLHFDEYKLQVRRTTKAHGLTDNRVRLA